MARQLALLYLALYPRLFHIRQINIRVSFSSNRVKFSSSLAWAIHRAWSVPSKVRLDSRLGIGRRGTIASISHLRSRLFVMVLCVTARVEKVQNCKGVGNGKGCPGKERQTYVLSVFFEVSYHCTAPTTISACRAWQLA